jgi:predicted Zn-dependent protease
VPKHYGLLVEVAQFYGGRGAYARAEELLAEALAESPELPEAYILRSEHAILQGRFQDGHALALAGLARAGPHPRLFAAMSESYVAKGDLEAAARARIAAQRQEPSAAIHWLRLAEIYDAMGRGAAASAARAQGAALASASP